MPNPASGIFTQAVGNIASGFFSTGLVVLTAIGPALLGVSALFVLFYLVAMSFGWRLKMPVRPGSKKGVLGNPKKVHFERGSPFSFRAAFDGVYSKFWTLQTPVSPTASFFLRPSHLGGGLSEGHASFGGGDFVDGFGADFMPIGDDDFADDFSDIDAVDAESGWYADPSFYASWTDDFGPDSAPGRQNGGVNQDIHDPEARYQFAQSILDKLSGGFTFCTVNPVSGESRSPSLQSNFFLGAVFFSDQPSWGFLDSYNRQSIYSDVSSAEDIMRGAEKAWLDMFGWELKLAPDKNSAFSAETTYHAFRIMELARMRAMGFEGSHSEFMDGLQGFEIGPDSEIYDDVDVDRGAYDH